jgi:hypothetical protein
MDRPSGPGDEHLGDATGEASACTGDLDPGPRPLLRLSREQTLTSLRDLVGDVPGLEAALGPAVTSSELGLIQADVSQLDLERYQSAADLVAAHVVAMPMPCDAELRACARTFIEDFAARAYRAPLEDEADLARHLALYDAGAATSHERGLELALRGILQAPRFVYRFEHGTSERVGALAVKLSGHEVAARLSYLFWNSLPDETLRAAADAGELDGEAGVLAELGRLLADPRGQAVLPRFLGRWSHLAEVEGVTKNAALFPEWASASFRAGLRKQAEHFFAFVLDHEGGSLDALLGSRVTFANAELAATYYGGSTGSEFTRLELPADRGAGMLTLPAFLALQAKPDESSPIYRGKFVRESLLCQTLLSPPADVPEAPSVEPGVSTRERLRQHEVDPKCSGCHLLMDPIGFTFEHFDAIGRYRARDGDEPVDASGAIHMAGALDGPLDGVVELAARLAESTAVEECVARQWFRFALGRFEQDVDSCTMEGIVKEFRAQGASLQALPRALVTSPAFLYRRSAP